MNKFLLKYVNNQKNKVIFLIFIVIITFFISLGHTLKFDYKFPKSDYRENLALSYNI